MQNACQISCWKKYYADCSGSGSFRHCFFLQSFREEALRLGLRGWVRNRADGSVELESEGEAAAVDELLAWLHHGPATALVWQVSCREITSAQPKELDFQIRPTV